jgi:hypothetical protein
VAAVALGEPVLMQDPPTTREQLVAREELTRFLERVLHMHREVAEVLATARLTGQLVQLTQAMGVVAVMGVRLQMAGTEGRE